MIDELNMLESKVVQAVSLCQELRAENNQLRQQLAAAEDARKGLCERMESARSRLEQLARQLPEAKATV